MAEGFALCVNLGWSNDVSSRLELVAKSSPCRSLESGDANEVLGKDFVFQLRALLTEKPGYNLRNLYTHGLLSDDSLHNHGLFNLWWILLRMILFVPWGHDWMQATMRKHQNASDEGQLTLET